MDELKALLRRVVVIQLFLLFSCLALPLLVRVMDLPSGKWLYGGYAILCIFQAVFLRKALAQLD